MEFLIVFFRDTLSGFVYFLYLALCTFAFFYVLGIVADRKRLAINEKLKEKKKYDIESGKEAMIAAMETKQVLDVDDENKEKSQVSTENQNATMNNALNSMPNMPDAKEAQKDDTPNVMVLNSNEVSAPAASQPVANQVQQVEKASDNSQQSPQQPVVSEPLVIDSSSIQL